MRQESRNVFLVTDYKGNRFRHASRHVCDARSVMHVGIANRGGGENVAGIPGARAFRNFTYPARGP